MIESDVEPLMKKCRYRLELAGLESIAHHTFAFCLSLADCALLRSEEHKLHQDFIEGKLEHISKSTA